MKSREVITAFSLLVLSACTTEPVEWGNVSYRQSRLGDPDARSAVMSANLPSVVGASVACMRSIRIAGAGADLFRAWWALRSDSSAVLSMQHSADGGMSWQARVTVEWRDHGHHGCDRPAPGVFYDPLSGYLHLVYFIESTTGGG